MALKVLLTKKYESVATLVEERNWKQTARDDDRIEKEVRVAIESNSKQVKAFLKGKERGYKSILAVLSKDLSEVLDMARVAKKLKEELKKLLK